MRYGPNRISLCSNSALRTVYGPRANVRKSSNFQVFLWFFNGWSSQTMIDTAKYHHASKRQALAHALGMITHDLVEESMLQSVRRFRKLLEDDCTQAPRSCKADWSSPKDLAVLAGRLSFDVMNQVCFGHSSDTLGKNDNRYMLGVISDGAQCLNTVRRYKLGPNCLLTTCRSAICRPCSTQALISCFFVTFFMDLSATELIVVSNANDA